MYSIFKTILLVQILIVAMMSPSFSADKMLSVVSRADGTSTAVGYQGGLVSIDIRVNDASMLAAAAFTVTYDPNNLALSGVTSTFFDTFAKQGIVPSQVTVGTVTYFRPVAVNPVSTGVLLAGARGNNGTGTNVTLFTLTFSVKGSTGDFPISVVQSKISDTKAGYSAAGEPVPFLIGTEANDYPVHTVTVTPGLLTITYQDADGDGLPDAWELARFGNLTTANGSTDWDRDGYTDLQEYLNQKNGVTDPLGAQFDPKTANAPGGTGYVKSDDGFWELMIPVIINSARESTAQPAQ